MDSGNYPWQFGLRTSSLSSRDAPLPSASLYLLLLWSAVRASGARGTSSGPTGARQPVRIELNELSGLPAPRDAPRPVFPIGRRESSEYIKFKGARSHWYSWPSNDYGTVRGWVCGEWRRRDADRRVVELWSVIPAMPPGRSSASVLWGTATVEDRELQIRLRERDGGVTVLRFSRRKRK